MNIAITGITTDNYCNGPGPRTILHFQGCSLGCSGCFNKHTWKVKVGEPIIQVLSELHTKCLAPESKGLTISGGEPLEQWHAFQRVCMSLRHSPDWGDRTIVVYSGFTLKEIADKGYFCFLAEYVDVLISGRFEEADKEEAMKGSSNQITTLFSGKITGEELAYKAVEVDIAVDSSILITGFPEKDFIKEMHP